MIPNKTDTENSRNNFVQMRLGELCEQKEIPISEIVKQPKRKIKDLSEYDEETSEILSKYRKFLCREYRKESTRRNYCRFVNDFLTWLYTTKGKNADQIIPEDTQDFKAFCTEKYAVNGNVVRLNALNNFTNKLLKRPDLRVSAPRSVHVNKSVLSDTELKQYINSAETPLEKLIVIYQVDGLLRPSEFSYIKLSNLDLDNQTLYLDDTKTGNNYIILSPRLTQAIKDYLPHRKPKLEFEDYLIIIPNGTYKGKVPKPFGGFINRTTKIIAKKAGITKYVAPYIIKPSSITLDFNKQINPKIIQRKARHRKIEATLRYDHVSDDMVREYFKKQNQNPELIKFITKKETQNDDICYI